MTLIPVAYRLKCAKLEEIMAVHNVVTGKYIVLSVKCIGDDSFLLSGCLLSCRTSQDKGEASSLEPVFQGRRKRNNWETGCGNVLFFLCCMSFRICLFVNINRLLKYYISDSYSCQLISLNTKCNVP